jgi:hypothetical protein
MKAGPIVNIEIAVGEVVPLEVILAHNPLPFPLL